MIINSTYDIKKQSFIFEVFNIFNLYKIISQNVSWIDRLVCDYPDYLLSLKWTVLLYPIHPRKASNPLCGVKKIPITEYLIALSVR